MPGIQTIPAARTVAASARAGGAIPHGKGETILVVDDEVSVLEITRALLEDIGYVVVAASSASRAIEAYAAHKGEIALVVTDMMMPGMTGADLAKALRLQDPHAKVVALSGYSRDMGSMEQGDTTVVAWLRKPVTLVTLAQTIRRAIDHN